MKRVASTGSELNDFSENEDGKKEYKVSKNRVSSLINLFSVARIYLPYVWFVVIFILAIQVIRTLYEQQSFHAFYQNEVVSIALDLQRPMAMKLGWKAMLILALLIWYINHREKPVYLMDFSVWEPPADWKLTPEQLMTAMKAQGCYTEDSLDFLVRKSVLHARPCIVFFLFFSPIIFSLLHNSLYSPSRKRCLSVLESGHILHGHLVSTNLY